MIKIKFFNPTTAISLVVLVAFFIDFNLKNWETQDRVIEHDIHSYYSYLPLLFIYNDIHEQKQSYQITEKEYLFWAHPDENGKRVEKMTLGLSIMYAPFFFIAHSFSLISNYPASGFTAPYKLFLLLAALFYLLLGLVYMSKSLKLLGYKDNIIAITVLLIGLGTNLLTYSSQSGTMPHVFSFCLFGGFMYNTILWHKEFTRKRLVYTGLLLGLITLIRPTNGLIAIFWIFYGITSFSGFLSKLQLIKKHFGALLIIPLLTIMVWVPQITYWKTVSGDFWYYSYRGEGFYFLDPYIWKGLFGFRKGWLIYTPMMICSLIGLFFLKNKGKTAKWAVLIFMIVNIYVIFSWWCWWYGGTFGQRALIEAYSLLAIPMAAFVSAINSNRNWLKVIVSLCALFFIWLNIFQTYQFENQSLHHDSMTKELYFKQFGAMQQKAGFYENLDPADYKGMQYRNGLPLKKKRKEQKSYFINKDVLIISKTGRYLIANRQKGDTLFADSGNPWEWETFRVEKVNETSFAIKSYNERYISVEFQKIDAPLIATSLVIGEKETFTFEHIENDMFAIKAVNGKYLSVNNFKIGATAIIITKGEQFEINLK